MFTVLVSLFAGFITGRLYGHFYVIDRLTGLMTPVIYVLLFMMGISTGMLEGLAGKWHVLGYYAFLIAAGATLGSVIAARIIRKYLSVRNIEGELQKQAQELVQVQKQILEQELQYAHPNTNGKNRFYTFFKTYKGSLIILVAFPLGIICGMYRLGPEVLYNNRSTLIVLLLLMFLAGINAGKNKAVLKAAISGGFKIFLLPIACITGTLAGSLVISLVITPLSWSECMAIGSGMGYYSLSSIMISSAKGPDMGSIALMANMIRELMALVLAPFFVRYFGKLAPISAGGATTMDTTLPVILKTSGQEYLIISLANGFCTDLAVPFLVSFFLLY